MSAHHLSAERSSGSGAFEVLTPEELADRWKVPRTWVFGRTRARCADPIPCTHLGRYVRFLWNSPALNEWFARQRSTDRGHHGHSK